ncbi:MAG TPA: MFS transporter [Anaerolineales bacterium]
MQRTTTRTIVLLTAGCFLAFFVFGFTDNLKGPTLPAMLAEMHFSYGTGGNIFFGEYLGFLIATLVTGILADRFGLKSAVLLAGMLLLVGVTGYSASHSAWLLAGSLFVIGMGLGALELGPNAIIVALHPERKGMFLNLMSVMHGMGSLFAPLIAGAVLAAGTSWRSLYRWDLILAAAFTVYFLAARFPKSDGANLSPIRFQDIPRFAFKGQLPWFHGAIALYVAVEIGMVTWLVTLLQEARGASVIASNRALTGFFALLMIGRFLGGFLVHRVGYLRSIFLAALGMLACLSLGLFGPPSFSFLLPATGFFCSIVFPTLTAAVSDADREHTNTVLGVLFTFAGLGGLVGPWLVAWGSELWGLERGFAVNVMLVLLLIGSLTVLMKGRQVETAAA